MDIGLYQFKSQFRSYLSRFLPYFEKVDPNWISLSLIPLSLLTAWIYTLAPDTHTLYFIAAILVFLRLLLGAMDGLVAEQFSKITPKGTLLNRICPEFADIALLLAIASSARDNTDLAIWALAFAWATSYLGIIGTINKQTIQSSGPVGQTDRLVALLIASLLSTFSGPDLWIELFFWWCIFGGIVTCALRFLSLWSDPATPASTTATNPPQ